MGVLVRHNAVDLNPNHSWTPYYHSREVTDSPYGIAIYKDDGPEIQAAFNCRVGGTILYNVRVTNNDPSGWVSIKPNGSSPSYVYFYMTFKNNSGSGADSFIGELNWDVPQSSRSVTGELTLTVESVMRSLTLHPKRWAGVSEPEDDDATHSTVVRDVGVGSDACLMRRVFEAESDEHEPANDENDVSFD